MPAPLFTPRYITRHHEPLFITTTALFYEERANIDGAKSCGDFAAASGLIITMPRPCRCAIAARASDDVLAMSVDIERARLVRCQSSAIYACLFTMTRYAFTPDGLRYLLFDATGDYAAAEFTPRWSFDTRRTLRSFTLC